MNRPNFRNLITFALIMANIIFFSLLYILFNNFYLENTKKKFIDENKYSNKVALELLEKEKLKLVSNARIVAGNESVYYAIGNQVYLDKKSSGNEKTSKIEFFPINKLRLIQMVNIQQYQLYGTGRGSEQKYLGLYNKNGKMITYANDFPRKSIVENARYIKDALGNEITGGVEVSQVEKIGEEFYIKGTAPILDVSDSAYKRYKVSGLAEVVERLDGQFLEELKKIINRDIIIVDNKNIYTSTLYMQDNSRIQNKKNNFAFDLKQEKIEELTFDNKKMYFNFLPILNYDKTIIGYIGVGFYKNDMEKIFKESSKNIIIYFAIFIAILIIVIYILIGGIFRPFNSVIESIKKIGEGNFEHISEKRFVKEFIVLTDSINHMSTAIKTRESELNAARETLFVLNEQLDEEVERKTASIKNILDNAEQGFFTFGKDLIIDNEYSMECYKMFGFDISGKKVSEIFKIAPGQESLFFQEVITNIYDAGDDFGRELYVSFLPAEIKIDGKFIDVKYKYTFKEEKIMGILSDRTEEKELERKIQEERNVLTMLVKTASNNIEIKTLLKEYEAFHREKISMFSTIEEINREIHTFKGSFAQLNFTNTAEYLNRIEDKIMYFMKENSAAAVEQLILLLTEDRLELATNKDMEIVEKYFGSDYIGKEEFVEIKEEVLIGLEEKMHSILSPEELNILLPDIRKMRYKSFKDMIKNYPEYTVNLGKSLEKEIEMFKIEGVDVLVDVKKYRDFAKSLIHIFRNIADHGIETPEKRMRAGKNTSGKISFNINKFAQKIMIAISDDGEGFDAEKIKRKLIEKNIYSEEGVRKLTEEQINESVFFDNFSTKDKATEISGRGIGMAAVKKEVDELGGEIRIVTSKGKGTTIFIVLPNSEADRDLEISGEQLLTSFVYFFQDFFEKTQDIHINTLEEIKGIDFAELNTYSTTINIKGSLHGDVVFSADKALAEKMVKYFKMNSESDECTANEVLEAITEILNIVIGNSSQYLMDNHRIIMTFFDVAELREGNNMKIVRSRFNMWGTEMSTNYGKMSLAFIEKGNLLKNTEKLEGEELNVDDFEIGVVTEDNINDESGYEIDLDEFEIEIATTVSAEVKS